VNIVEHLAAKEPDVSLRSWWRQTELKQRKLHSIPAQSKCCFVTDGWINTHQFANKFIST